MLLRCVCFLSCFFSFSAFANLFNEYPPHERVRLFAMHGSNTIGAEMAPNLLHKWFAINGLEQVRVLPTATENERLIIATHPTRFTTFEVLVAAHGSGTGYQHLYAGSGDIAASSRPINRKELTLLEVYGDMRSAESEHVVAIDGLAMIVHPDNPITQLDVATLAAIFSGEIQNWAELGGPNGQIKVYARDDQSGTWDSFKSMVLGKYTLSERAARYESNAQLSDLVAQDRNAIGFVGLSSVRSAKLLRVFEHTSRPMLPNALTVATEDYILSRRLFMYTAAKPNAMVASFMEFVLSDEGQQVVADTGFISQKIEAVIPEFYADLPLAMQEFTQRARRLTVNFRFDQGRARLDNKAFSDLARLTLYAKQHPQAEFLLIGFGDPKKTGIRSQLLSRLRAMTVRRELVKEGVFVQGTLGFGDDFLVAGIEVNEARVRNRRVEVWVR